MKTQLTKIQLAAEVMEALKFIYPEHLYGPERYGVEFAKLRMKMSLEEVHGHLGECLEGSDAMMPSSAAAKK